MDLKDLRVNGKRLQSTLEDMAKIGATPGGGVQRLTLTDEDKQAETTGDLFGEYIFGMQDVSFVWGKHTPLQGYGRGGTGGGTGGVRQQRR